jgi:flagellar basal body rod protein FlgG
MKKVILTLLLLFPQILLAQDISDVLPLFDEYMILLIDLSNANTTGYKSHLLSIDYSYNRKNNIIDEPRGVNKINFSQGAIQYTNRELDFMIIGDGFFKIILYDGSTAYTRSGEFMIDRETNELVTVNGGNKLFDTIRIESGYTSLLFNDDHSIITIYPNGDEINNGKLNIYYLDTDKLKYFGDFPSSGIFFYDGNEEKIIDGRIEHRFIEQSNVIRMATIVRLIKISKILGINIENNVE